MVIFFQLRASTPSSKGHSVRLACLRHAASVHPEPGSNSQKKYKSTIFIVVICFLSCLYLTFWIDIFAQFSKIISAFSLKALLIYHLLFIKSRLISLFFSFFYFFVIFRLSFTSLLFESTTNISFVLLLVKLFFYFILLFFLFL